MGFQKVKKTNLDCQFGGVATLVCQQWYSYLVRVKRSI